MKPRPTSATQAARAVPPAPLPGSGRPGNARRRIPAALFASLLGAATVAAYDYVDWARPVVALLALAGCGVWLLTTAPRDPR